MADAAVGKMVTVLECMAAISGADWFLMDRSGRVRAQFGRCRYEGRIPSTHPAFEAARTMRVVESGNTEDSRRGLYLPLTDMGSCVGVIGVEMEGDEAGTKIKDVGLKMQRLTALVQKLPNSSILGGAPDESFLEAALSMYDDPALAVDATGRMVRANAQALSLFGRGIVGEWFEDRFPESGFGSAWTRLRAEGKSSITALLEMSDQFFQATLRVARSGPRTVGLVLVLKPQVEGDKRKWVEPWSFDEIKGVSPSIMRAKEMAMKVAKTDSTVLLLGESGTGKELFARAIHGQSARAHRPFVAINCAAIPETLLESELFGYEGGAFTGARPAGKPGKFEVANGGTVFLDEIGDMPLALQSKLLRVLQDRQVERVGGVSPIDVDVRVISASHKNLEELVARGDFREDLYFRLAVIPLEIPPLRERKEDLYLLLEHYLRKYRTVYSKKPMRFSSEALEILFRYDWPGNVRELENTVEYIVNMESGDVITAESLPPRLLKRQPAESQNMSISCAEAEAIRKALETYGTSARGKEKAAQALGIHRATLYRKIKKLGLDT